MTPLVGREHEVGLLRARWTQAKDGMGQVVMLSGEAGIGKSRLGQVLKEHLTGEHTRIECQCSPYYQHTAFYPVVTYLQRFLQFTREEPVEERLRKLEDASHRMALPVRRSCPCWPRCSGCRLPRIIPHSPSRLSGKAEDPGNLAGVAAAEAERQPVCVVMEDLHGGPLDAGVAQPAH